MAARPPSTHRLSGGVAAVLALVLLTPAAPAQATGLLQPVGTPPGNRVNDFSGTVGTRFTVTSAGTVTALGYEDAGGNGLNTSHTVGLWSAGGTLLASTTVPAGTAANLSGVWRYATLAVPVSLTANTTYVIGGTMSVGDGDGFSDSAGGAANFSYSQYAGDANPTNVFVSGFSLSFPNTDGGGTDLRWGPANALFTPVPEPATALVAAAELGVVAFRRR